VNGLSPTRTWAAAALAAAVLYFCFFSRAGAFGLIGPDEPRYASIARAMLETGDWVTPRLDGQPWLEKPILYYWSAAAAFRLFGVNDFSARLPSAVLATLAALALVWLARKIYGAETAWAVLLIFPTCVGVFAFARAGATDMPFSASLALAMVAAYRALGDGRQPPRRDWQILFGALLGVAALAKGPAAIVLAGGSAGLWALATRRWKQAWRLAHPLVVLAFCAVALPWYALCATRNPEFLSVFLLSHNVERFLTPVFQHEQPFWFYGPILLLGLLPWSALLAGAARDALALWREKKLSESPEFFFACWAVFPLVFFSVSRSKLPGYILPVFAPLALLLARSLTRAIEQNDSFAQWQMEWTGVTFLVLAGVTGYRLSRLPSQMDAMSGSELAVWITAIMTVGLVVSGLGWARKYRASLTLAAVLMAGLIEGVNLRIAPLIDHEVSPRAAARAIQKEARAGENVAVYHLHRAWHYGLNYYLRRELPAWQPGSEAARPGLVVTSATGIRELETAGVKFRVIARVAQLALIVRVE
jgi:4-amino-4-deoxy-L-arabinose transferase-like glycosyltransferase